MQKSEKLQRLLAVLATWAVLLVIFFGYERYFVKGQQEFVRERNFRALAALSKELSFAVDKVQKSSESLVKVASKENYSSEGLLWYVDHYVGISDKSVAGKAARDASTCVGSINSGKEKVPLEAIADAQTLTLSVSCFTAAKPDDPDLPVPKSKVLLYRLDLTESVAKGFEREGAAFDDVLVADKSGRVLFQKSLTAPRIVNLRALENATSQTASQPTTSVPSASAGADPQAKTPAENALQSEKAEASTVATVTEAGATYEMFAVPTRIVLRSPENPPRTWDLLVVGLRGEERSERDAHQLPFSALIWTGMTGVVLFSLSWPLFKLQYMSSTERFTPKDGWFLIIAMVVASTTGMLMLLNASYTSWSQDGEDLRMRRIADQIKANFGSEMSLALRQIHWLREDAISRAPEISQPSVAIPDYLQKGSRLNCYPYFEIAFWANEQGQQRLKFDVRPLATPPINVSPLPFFRKILFDGNWITRSEANGPDPPCSIPDNASNLDDAQFQKNNARTFDGTYLQPVLSQSTGEFLTVLAGRVPGSADKNKGLQVEGLAMRPMSLVDPVLPPGYGFAVIDEKCNVLFHSQAFRNMRENFCEESKDPAELLPWLLSGVDSSIDISYSGQPERAYLTSLKDGPRFATGPAFLIIFRQPDTQLTLNLAVILVCSILLGTYFAVLLLAAAVHLSLRGPLHLLYAPDFMWPRADGAVSYVAIFAANGFMFLLYWLAYRWLFEAPLLALSLVTALLSVTFSILKLRSQDEPLFRLGMILGLSGGLGFLLDLLWSRLGDGFQPQWIWFFALIAVFGLTALALAQRSVWSRSVFGEAGWIRGVAEKHFSVAYSLAALSLITLVGLVPCTGFFKYSYDAVSELSLKHDELMLSTSLLARRDRIREYYDKVVTFGVTQGNADNPVKQVAKLRIGSTGDLYDVEASDASGSDRRGPVFTVTDEPTLEQPIVATPAVTPASDDSLCQGTGLDFNGRIERRIARATLQFPSNPLGNEMSKLGVASTEEVKSAWEHCWTEEKPQQFRMLWKSDSRLPRFSVTAHYNLWRGLKWWAGLGLLLLWVLLAVWIMSLVKKIFFTDIDTAPPFPAVDWTGTAQIDRDFLIIGLAKSGKSEWLKRISGLRAEDVLDMRVELRKMVDDPKYQSARPQGSLIVLDHFDFNLRDCRYNMARLNLLESLICGPACRVVAISTVDLLYFLTEESAEVLCQHHKDPAAAGRLLDRWVRVLSKFKKVRPKDSAEHEFQTLITDFVKNHPALSKIAIRVSEECNHTAMLRKIGQEILENASEKEAVSYEGLVNNILDRADAYYHVLWSGLTTSERLVLYQLALDGWANAKNTSAIQQLERKQLIYKAPMYRIMNESFRRFIASTEHSDEMARWQSREQQSTWRAFRVVLIAAAIGTGIWLLYTQATLSQAVAGYIAAAATLLTAIGSLFARSGSAKPQASDKESA